MGEKINKYVLLGLSVILLGILLIFYIPRCGKKGSEESISKIEVWTLTTDDDKKKDVLLPKELYREDGGLVKIQTQLSDEFKSAQILCFWTYFQDVEVYLDEEKIYPAIDMDRFGKAAVSQWNYVDVPENADGKQLTICLSTQYKSYKYCLDEVVYGSRTAIDNWMISEFALTRVLDLALLGTGVVFMVFTIFSKHDMGYRACQFFFGLTALLFGIWLRTSMKGLSLDWVSPYANVLLGYLAFFLISITLTIYVKIRALKISPLVKICDIFILADAVIIPIVFLLQALNIRDIRENLIVGYICLFISVAWAVSVAMYYYIKARERIHVLTVVNGFLFVIAVISISMNQSNFRLSFIRWDLLTRVCVMTIITFEFVMLFSHLKYKEELQKAMEQQNQNLKLQFLTSQIRPHFILNTLGAIRSMIHVDADYAYELLYDFSKYIRKNMEEKDYTKPIPFLEEMDHIDTYLRLEKLRFGERIKVEKDLETSEFWVLPLTIQPFVENAVKHGLMEAKYGGTIWIRSRKLRNGICVEIEDNGVGFDTGNFWKDLDNAKSVGMRSAIYRLKYDMGGECTVRSNTKYGTSGTIIHIELPLKRGDKGENYNRR